jgi:hypothetical protein
MIASLAAKGGQGQGGTDVFGSSLKMRFNN